MKFLIKLKNKKYIVAIALILLVLGFGLRTFILSRNKQPESAFIQKGDLEQTLTISGKIDAEEHATLQFQTGGKLAWVGVKEGDYVYKYQGLASLDQQQVKKTLEKKLNDYLKVRWDFEQTKDDNPDKALHTDRIRRIVEKTQFDLNNSVLDVEIQNLAVELSSITSPIDGIVTRIDTPYAGVNIYAPNQAQFEIVNPNTIFFTIDADQTEIVNLKEGLKGTIVFDSYPNEKIEGIITNLSFTPEKDESKTVYKVKIKLTANNTNYKYRVGMTGDISFIMEKMKNIFYIPQKFVKTEGDNKYLLLGKDKKKIYIKTGFETDTDIQIIGEVKKGDIVND